MLSQKDMGLEPEVSMTGKEEQELLMERVLAEASAPMRGGDEINISQL